jgi:hypothetical protein
MSTRWTVVVTAMLASLAASGCADVFSTLVGVQPVVQIKVVNDSERQTVSPNIAVCPNSIEQPPHYFVDIPPVLGPGESITYTTEELAGSDGNCRTFNTSFMLGICTWQFGPTRDDMTTVDQRFGGRIGSQFQCGDTVILHWLDTDEVGGSWTAEVVPARGNQPPSASFQSL